MKHESSQDSLTNLLLPLFLILGLVLLLNSGQNVQTAQPATPLVPRQRQSLAQFVFSDKWGNPAPLVS